MSDFIAILVQSITIGVLVHFQLYDIAAGIFTFLTMGTITVIGRRLN